MLTGAPFFELQYKDGSRHARDVDRNVEEEEDPTPLTASIIKRVLAAK